MKVRRRRIIIMSPLEHFASPRETSLRSTSAPSRANLPTMMMMIIIIFFFFRKSSSTASGANLPVPKRLPRRKKKNSRNRCYWTICAPQAGAKVTTKEEERADTIGTTTRRPIQTPKRATNRCGPTRAEDRGLPPSLWAIPRILIP